MWSTGRGAAMCPPKVEDVAVRRIVSLVVSGALVVAVATVLPGSVPAAAAAADQLSLTKAGPGEILVGTSGRFTLTATNLGTDPQYNVSFRDVLPLGVTYAGPTSPSDIGDPTIIGDGVTTPETLIWSDAFDLQPDATNDISFGVTPSPARLPVGDRFDNTATVYGSNQPRTVPRFDTAGQPIASPDVTAADSNTVTTNVTALEVTKDEPSPESELLRGVHDQSTVYTLVVTNNPANPTDSVTVTDYLPADQEFLGCGNVDNTSGGAREYPGAPPLSVVPDLTTNCPTPGTVDTVTDPPGHTGVFTKVVWSIGNLAPGASTTITYRAGVPLRENVAFPAGTPTTGIQAANLDNNTGPLTRQEGEGAASTNFVEADGTYMGTAVGGEQAVSATAQKTVTVHDVRIHKSVSPTAFVSGDAAEYTLTIDTGEYEDASDIEVTDVLPNGVCPLDDVANYAPAVPSNSDCAPDAQYAPSDPYQSVTEQAGVGTFTVHFTPLPTLAHDSTTTITYYGRMRTVYTDGPLKGEPTSAGDSFTNNAEQTSTTTPQTANDVDTGTASVTDPTSATQTTGGPTLTKQIAERETPMSCAEANYRGLVDPVPPELTFTQGDRVCFVITVHFSDDADSRNPVVTDFLPANMTYEPESFTAGAQDTVPGNQFGFDESRAETAGELVWTLGATTGQGQHEIAHGSVFQAVFSAIVTGTAVGPLPDKAGNLAKFREENSSGEADSLRDGVNFAIAPAPVDITKGVAQLDGTTYNPPQDGVPAREGSAALFHVDVSNTSDTSTAPPGTAIDNVKVWDVLPAGVPCTAISGVSDSGVCTDPGDAGQPTFAGNTTHSAIVWNGGVTIPAGGTHSYTYTMTVPAGTSVEDHLVNTAYIRSYDVATDIGGGDEATHYPAQNVDTSLPAGTTFEPNPASDPSDVVLPAVGVTKTVTSAVNEADNVGLETPPGSGSTVGVPGEGVTYTVSARVPAHATVYGATLSDALPSGLVLDSSSAQFAPDASAPVYQGLPAGVSLSGVTISFGTQYDNTTSTDQLFTLTITGHLDQADATDVANGKVVNNTGTFHSVPGPDGGPAPADHTATATVDVAEPSPALTKTNDKASPATVTAGTTVTYTLKAADAAGRPPLHDGWVVDCVPSALTFTGFATIEPGTTATTKGGGNGGTSTATACATGLTEIDWNVGDLAPGATKTLTYTATVNPGAAGNVTYTNTANLTGNSLAGARTAPTDAGNPFGRGYIKQASSAVTVAAAGITKTVSPSSATIGDTVTYTVTATLPADVTFYDLSVIDMPPAAVTPLGAPDATVTCTNADGSACPLTTATPLTSANGRIGWLIGDAAESAQVRTVVLTYQARVADVGSARVGATPTNSATAKWDTTSAPAPTAADATFDQTSGSATATLTVQEPSVTIGKAVTTTTPQPGATFTYTVTATNSNATNTSAAYNIAVTDAVPTGVVVDPASISNGGTISGAGTDGGGTISWTIAGPLAKGASQPMTYSATLAATNDLSGAGLKNTATLAGYDSRSSGGRHYTGSTATATVTPLFPSLSATKSATGGPVTYIGAHYQWTVTVTNAAGAGTAYAVGATDVLPLNWSYDTGSAIVTRPGIPPTPIDPVQTSVGGPINLEWSSLGSLSAGQSLTITYTATPGPDVVTAPGVGHAVDQTNTVRPTGADATGATHSASGSFLGGPVTAVTHIDSADVQVAKSVGTAPIAGQDGTWTIIVSNAGPDPAVGPFSVVDPFDQPLPSGVTLVNATGTGWTCTTGPITCSRTNAADTLASGASFPAITVRYHVASGVADGTTLDNSASASARTHDPDPSNNSDDANTTVHAVADLGLTKQLVDDAVVPGSVATYTVSVTNYGPSDSQGPIAVTDTLPAGSTFVSAAGTGWSCPDTATGGAITCTRSAALPAGTAAGDIVVKVRIPSDQSDDVVNTATVTPTTSEPNPDDTHPDSDTVRTTPSPSADVEISKVLADPPVVAGGTSHYTITVINHGPSDAQHVVVTDTLPALLDFDSVSNASDWDCGNTGKQVTCTYTAGAALAAGDTSSFTLAVTVGQQFQGTVRNTAHVTSDTPDPDTGNNTSNADAAVTDKADLSIEKSHSGTATAGRNLTYTLQVHNHGTSDEHGDITVTDPLPANTTFVSADGPGWSCSSANGTVTCTGATDLAAGDDADPITVVVHVDSDAGPTTLSNTATVTGSTDSPDPNPDNNSDTDEAEVQVSTALSLTKTLDTATPVIAGTTARFTLHVSNAGPSDAESVVVTDSLPAHLSFASGTGTGWTCLSADRTVVTCTRAALAAGASSDITLVADVAADTPDRTTVENVAAVSSGSPGTVTQPDPVPVPIQRRADLVLRKTAESPTAVAGMNVTWQLQVSNAGPSDAEGPITVTDTLPGFETFVSADGAGWTCTPGAPPVPPGAGAHQIVNCVSTDPLAAGADAVALEITAAVDPAAPVATQTNSATVDSPTTDPTPGNNTDSAAVTISRSGQLSIVKTHTGHGTVGEQLVFGLAVHNAGPSQADQVVVSDPLPTGLTFVSADGTGWTCAVADGTVTCTLAGPLDPGSDAPPITLTTTVHAAAYPRVVNSATVHSADPDLPGSDTSDDPVVVDPDAQLTVTKHHEGTFTVGAEGRYAIVVRNAGPTSSPGPITVTDRLPAGLSFASVSGAGWQCGRSGDTLTCTRAGELAVGATTTITVGVHVLAAAFPQVQNTATASGPGSSDASATDTASVAPLARLHLSKTLHDYSDGVATWAIKLTNEGPNPTGAPARIVDDLPSGLRFRSVSGPGWSCVASGQTVTCTHAGAIDVHSSVTVTVRTTVTAAAGTHIVNVARGSSGESSVDSASAKLTVSAEGGATAATGVAGWSLLRLALLLMLAGAAALVAGRRRRA